MAYYLTVSSGEDEGRSFRIESGEYLIGRSPHSKIKLKDADVAFEHAKLREEGGKLFLQNLSSVGTRVKGQRITDEVRLTPNTEIMLTDTCRLVVEQRLAGGAGASGAQTILLVILLMMLVVGGVGFVINHRGAAVERPMLERHWRQAYFLLDARLAKWVDRRQFPAEAAQLFREAWRIDQAGNALPAAIAWEKLESVLMVVPMKVPAVEENLTFSAAAGPTARTLGVVMGWDTQAASTDFRAETDEGYADALVWFVRKRADVARANVEE